MAKLASRIQGPVAVIGDVHGQIDQLVTIIEKLKKRPDWDSRWLVFIGDLVDRGPDPRATVDLVCDLLAEHPRTTVVCGNHELAMAGALGLVPVPEYAQWNQRWVADYGSESTFSSYGVEHGDLAALKETLPDPHAKLLSDLPWAIEHPEFLFVHAGLDPNTPFEMQLRILRQKDFTLNRPPWLCSKSFVTGANPAGCPVAVVSGHVKVPEVKLDGKRILIDTTGGEGGDLSCVLLPERRVISSSRASDSNPQTASAGSAGGKSWWKIW